MLLKFGQTLSWRFLLRVLAVLSLLVAAVWLLSAPDLEKLLAFLTAIAALLASPAVSDKPIAGALASHPTQELESRNRRAMLERVEGYWVKGVLEHSLHSVGLIDLGMSEDAAAVDHPWDISLFTSTQTRSPLPPGEKIIHLFERSGRALLLLGGPGCGKTTMLLEFARDMIAIARSDPQQAIPVVLNLSSWVERKGSIVEWVVEELRTKYYVKQQITRTWIEKEALILLLDGLDEVRQALRADCVKAINEFRQSHGLTGLLVTSRIQDYEHLATHLQLHRALVIESLSQEQVDRYLEMGGPALAALRQELKDNALLRELAHTPLMLSVMALAYKDKSTRELKQLRSSGEYARHIFCAYVKQMFRRKAAGGWRAPDQVVSWLAWLAKTLHQQNASVFQIESLQPFVIPGRVWRGVYFYATRLASGSVIAIGITLFWSVLVYLTQYSLSGAGLAHSLVVSGKFFVPIFGLSIGLVTGSVDFARGELGGLSPLAKRLPGYVGQVFRILVIGLLHAGVTGIAFWMLLPHGFAQASAVDSLVFGLMVGATVGMVVGLLAGSLYGLRGGQHQGLVDIKTVEALSWSWRGALRKGLLGALVGVAAAFFLALIVLLALLLADTLGWFSQTDIFGSVQFGGLHDLRLFLQSIWIAGKLFAYALVPVCALFGAVLGGLSGYAIDKKTTPNQGVKLSIKSAVLAGLAVTAGGAIIATLAFSRLGIDMRLVDRIGAGTVAGAGCGLLAFLWYGGIDAIHHYTLRAVLSLNGCLPLRVVRFLDHATRNILVHKVGGGYIFIHRLLMEYFAELHRDPAELLDLQQAVAASRS